MRISIIVKDGTVVIDGMAVFNVDLSSIASDVHAIQWYGTDGEVEITNDVGRHIENRVITDFSDYQRYVDDALRMKAEYDASVRVYENSELVTPPVP